MRTEQTARKTHTCDNCGCNIEKGERYFKEMIWSSGEYDRFDFEWNNGYMMAWREHVNSDRCATAIHHVQEWFAASILTPPPNKPESLK